MPILDRLTPQSYIPYLATGTGVFSAAGSPEGVQNGGIGSVYTDLVTGFLYTKTTPYALTTGWLLGGGGGGGSVTSFSAGNLSPLFTTNVATPTTTPALTFAQVNQNANLVFAGPATGVPAAPTFRALVAADIPGLASPPAGSVQFNDASNGFLGDPDFIWDTASGTLQLGLAAARSGKLLFRSLVSGSVQLTVDNPASNFEYVFANAAGVTGQVPVVTVAGNVHTFGWLTPSSGDVLPGVAQRVAYYPATASQVDDAVGFEYNHSSSQDVFIQAQSTTRLPLSLKAFSSGQIAGYFQCLNESDVFKFGVSYAGGWGAAGDSYFSLTGSDSTFPRRLQLQNIAAGNAFRFEGMHEGDGFQQIADGKFQFENKFGFKLVGTSNSNFSQAFEAGATTDPALLVQNGLVTVTPLYVNAITSTSVKPFIVGLNLSEIFGITTGGQCQSLNGSASAPSYSFSANPTVGLYQTSAGVVSISGGSAEAMRFTNSFVALPSASLLTWNIGSNDLTMRRLAAASLVQGNANSGAPIANLFTIGESSRSGTDSNVSGANGTLQSGLGTGNAALAQLLLRAPIKVASGTTAQTYATGLSIIGGAAKLTSYTVATLPPAADVGDGATAFVTDALAPTFGSAVVGGGAVPIPVHTSGGVWNVG